MPPVITWIDVQAELDTLKAAALSHPFDKQADHIQKVIDAEPKPPGYTPEVVKVLIEVLRKMLEEADTGKPAHEVFELARTTGFINPIQDVGTIVQNTGPAVTYLINIGADEVKKDLPTPALEIPVVLLVMTQAEAAALANGTVFQGLPQDFADDFQALQTLLMAPQVGAWPGHYGVRPQDWQPFPNKPNTIEQMVRAMFAEVQRRNRYQRTVRPRFINIYDLINNREELRQLRRDGCMIIKDVISMRHPDIQKAYRLSLLDAFPNTIIIRVAPLTNAFAIPQPLFNNWLEHYQDLEFYKRLYVDYDPKCDEVSRDVEFNRMLIQSVPELIPKEERVKSVMTDHVTGGGAR